MKTGAWQGRGEERDAGNGAFERMHAGRRLQNKACTAGAAAHDLLALVGMVSKARLVAVIP